MSVSAELEAAGGGGLSAGSAIAGTTWLWAFAGAAVVTRVRHPAPRRRPARARAHDVFEQSHRWGGWTALALFWALTIELAVGGARDAAPLAAIASDWHVWVLVVLTACIGWPWLRLRRVPITVHRPSLHAAIVELDDGVRPAYSSAVGISRRPLGGWHVFATVTTPGRPATDCSSHAPATGRGASSTTHRCTCGCAASRSRRRWRRRRTSTLESSTW